MICIAFQAKCGVMGFSHPRLRPGLLSLRSWRLPDAVWSNNSGSFQHRDAEESEILLSGFSVPLWLYLGLRPGLLTLRFIASSRRFCQTTVVLFNTETQRNRRFSSQGPPCLCGYKDFIPGYSLRSWRLPDASVKQRRFFSTQRRRGFGDSPLRVLCTSVVIILDSIPSFPRSARGVFQTLLSNCDGSFQH